MAEFAVNNNKSASIKLSPFFVTKNFYPRMSFNIIDFSNTSTCKQILKQKALNIFGKIKTTKKFVWKALAAIQKSQSKQADKDQKNITYVVGNKVWLFTKNINID